MLTPEQRKNFEVSYPDCDIDKAISHMESKYGDKITSPVNLLHTCIKSDRQKFARQELQEHTGSDSKPKNAKELENAEAYRKSAIEKFKAEHNILTNGYHKPRYNYGIEATGTIEEKSCIERALRTAFNPETEQTYEEWMQKEYAIFCGNYQNFNIDFDNVIKSFVDNLDKHKGTPLHDSYPNYFTYRCRKVADQCLKVNDPDDPDRIKNMIRYGMDLNEALNQKQKEEMQQVKNDICQPVMEELF